MPTIKTGDWLKAILKEKEMTQKELANKSGVSIPAISKIILGERYGSPKTWEKITAALEADFSLSVDSSEFICELKEEIREYGPTKLCNVFYIENHGNIIFKDYLLFPEDMKELYKGDLREMNMLRVTLQEALDLFIAQNKIF